MTRCPNILFLFSDEHNAKCIGHTGQTGVKTPHLDRLAEQGTRFNRAVTQSPICTPSRISFASGQYPHNHGYYGLAGRQEGDGPNLIDHLPHLFGHFKRQGYAVGAVGKSHLPPDWIEPTCDRFAEDKDPEHGYPAYLRANGIDPSRSASLSWGERVRAAGDPPKFNHDFGPDELGYEHSVEHWEASEAIAFLEQHRDEPMFLQVGFWRPHTPCTPAPEFWEMYPEESLTEPPNADVDMSDMPAPLRRKREQLETLSAEQFLYEPRDYRSMRRRYLRGYYGCISQMDRAIGEILEGLDRLGLSEDTIVIYTSDHGDFADEYGLTEKAPGIWTDSVTRIPLIWRWPGQIAAGEARGEPVESVDMAPTLCDLAGLEAMPTADGRSLAGTLLEGDGPPPDRIAVTETPRCRAVYDSRYRLVHPAGPYAGETDNAALYDHQHDPWETRNLYHDPDHAEIVRTLERRLLDWLMNTTRITAAHPSLDGQGKPYGKQSGGRAHPVDVDGRRGSDYLDAIAAFGDNYL